MAHENAFDLDGGDVFAARDDHILEPIANLHIPVRMDHRGVTAVEPAVADRVRGCLGVVVVTLHDDVAANHDFAQRLSVARYFAAVIVDDAQLARGDELDALARLYR